MYELFELPSEPSFDLTLVLQAQESDSTLAGRVVDGEGEGIPDAYVALGLSATKSDAEGRFTLAIGPRSESDKVLWAAKAGLLPACIERDPAASWPDPIELVLAGTPLSIQGRVLDEQGKPVAGARVWTDDTTDFGAIEVDDFGPMTTIGVKVEGILSGQLWLRHTETDRDGAFSLKGLLARDYRLSVLDQPTLRYVLSEPIPAGRSDVRIHLRDEELVAVGIPAPAVVERDPGERRELRRQPERELGGSLVRLPRPRQGREVNESGRAHSRPT